MTAEMYESALKVLVEMERCVARALSELEAIEAEERQAELKRAA